MLFINFLMIMISLILINSSHPITILCLILIQTLMICSLMWLNFSTSWFSFILFLIFLGGLMILFVYVVSLASNEKFEINFSILMVLAYVSLLLMSALMISIFFENIITFVVDNMIFKIMIIFSQSILLVASLMMCYLFLTLLVAIKISSKFEGPLRNLN